MGFTKEEYEGAITDVEQALCELEELRTQVSVNCIFNEGLEKLKQLIKEHFDNPPLKFEEIKNIVNESPTKNVAIYDDERKCYIELYLDNYGALWFFDFGNECDRLFIFEDNRFYRREVDSKDGK